jgi:hypothetical protein
MMSLHEFLFREFQLQSPKGSSTGVEESHLITTDGGPLIWLHFVVSDTGSWRSQRHSWQECRNVKLHEAPFGAACGHRQWSPEGKELAELSSYSGITTWSVKTLRHRISEMKNVKCILIRPVVTASGHME